MNKKNVMFIISPFFGGASRMTINISNLLDRNVYNVYYLVYAPKMEEIRNYIPDDAVVFCLNIKNIWDFSTYKLYKIFKQHSIDIVFSSFTFINIRVAIASKIHGSKTILRSSNFLKNFKMIERYLMKLTYPLADIVIAQQEEMRLELASYIPQLGSKLITLHNFMDYTQIDENIKEGNPYYDDNQIRFIWMGRVTKTKGYDVLLNAFAIVRNELPNAHLYLLGRYEEDEFYRELKRFIREKHLESFVHFEGLVKNPHKWVKHADCFVLPSRLEGLPNALLEAMYIGIPVVSTTCIPIISRIVEEGVNGYTVPVEDPNAMAIAMINALSLKNCHLNYDPASRSEYLSLFK